MGGTNSNTNNEPILFNSSNRDENGNYVVPRKLQYPTDCAPLTSRDGKTVSWAECSNSEPNEKCKRCVPDETKNCGQQLLASGLDIVPQRCFPKCCVPEKERDLAQSKDKFPSWPVLIVVICVLSFLFCTFVACSMKYKCRSSIRV